MKSTSTSCSPDDTKPTHNKICKNVYLVFCLLRKRSQRLSQKITNYLVTLPGQGVEKQLRDMADEYQLPRGDGEAINLRRGNEILSPYLPNICGHNLLPTEETETSINSNTSNVIIHLIRQVV